MNTKIAFLLVIGCASVMGAPQFNIFSGLFGLPQQALSQALNTINQAANLTEQGVNTAIKTGQNSFSQALDTAGNVLGELNQIPLQVFAQGQNIFDQALNATNQVVDLGEESVNSAVQLGEQGLESAFQLPQNILNSTSEFNLFNNLPV